MCPRQPIGRPPRPWTHRQQRQLIRLYTLTSVSNAEILAVLQSEGFSPRLVMVCRFSSQELIDYLQRTTCTDETKSTLLERLHAKLA